MKQKLWKNTVFNVSAIIIIILVIIGIVLPAQFGNIADKLFNFTTIYFGWFYLISVFIIILFLIFLAISNYGKIRLGGEDSLPEFSFFTWIGMLFSAGMGVGLVFWGVAEPMSHFFTTPFKDINGQTVEAARTAIGYSFFHWGVSQWAVFAIVGLVIGFMQFRKKKDGLVSTALENIVGNKKATKNTIDILSVIATVMGVATSLGLGALQMAGGLNVVFNWDNSIYLQFIIIGVVFVLYMLSATTGVDKGIKILSNLNLGLAIGLTLLIFIMGPSLFILETFTVGIGDYFTHFIEYTLRLQPYQGGTWVRDWTIFYWAWAIAWSPFVGAFVARVSKGRTIREYITGVMVVPSVIACFWIATFGGTSLFFDLNKGTNIAEVVNQDITHALFKVYEYLPLSNVLSLVSILLIFTFLVTSADSATFVLASMTNKGSTNPPQKSKLIWGFLMSGIAVVLLYAGGLESLQTASLIAALPFTVILLGLIVAIYKNIRKEPIPISERDIKRFKRIEKALKNKEDMKKEYKNK